MMMLTNLNLWFIYLFVCLFLTFQQSTKSLLWVWTMPERQPSCISCKCLLGDVKASTQLLAVQKCWFFFCFVLFCSHASSLTKEAVHTSPTIGSNVEQITVRKTHFLVWDIGGQESLRASWYSYYCNTEVQINNNNTTLWRFIHDVFILVPCCAIYHVTLFPHLSSAALIVSVSITR